MAVQYRINRGGETSEKTSVKAVPPISFKEKLRKLAQDLGIIADDPGENVPGLESPQKDPDAVISKASYQHTAPTSPFTERPQSK